MQIRAWLAAALTLTANLGAENWPNWRGPAANGATKETGFPISWTTTNNVLWRLELPEPGNSSPIIWKDRVFVTQAIGNQRAVICVDRKNGNRLWAAGPVYDLPEQRMEAANPYCAASPVTDGTRVIALFGSAGLYCFDFKGRELWKIDLGKIDHRFGTASSPALSGDNCFVYVGPGNVNEMVAINKQTGKILWRAPGLEPNADERKKISTNGPPTGSWSSPTVIEREGRKEVVMSFAFRYGAYDFKTGKLNWEHPGLGLQTYPNPFLFDDTVMAISGTTAVALRPPNEVLWTQPRGKFRFGNGVAAGRYLFQLAENGLAECWEKETGKVLWQERLQGPGKKTTTWSSLSMAGDKIYAPNQSGDVFVFAAAPTFKILSTNSVAEPTNASLALGQGCVVMRTDKALWCFKQPS